MNLPALALLVFITGAQSYHEDFDSSEFRSDGDEVDPPHKYPYAVFLSIINVKGKDSSCSAVLIGSRYALTTAHCAKATNFLHYKAYLGSHFPKEGTHVGVEKVLVHEDYDGTKEFGETPDLALLRLGKDVSMSNRVKTIELSETPMVAGTDLTIMGWGDTREGEPTTVLRSLNMTVTDYAYCHQYYNFHKAHVAYCVSSAKGKARHGDSGGPVINKDGKLVGLVMGSKPEKAPEHRNPTVVLNIATKVDWIKKNMGRAEANTPV